MTGRQRRRGAWNCLFVAVKDEDGLWFAGRRDCVGARFSFKTEDTLLARRLMDGLFFFE